MAQQINLCTPILLTPKRYFSANTMAATVGVFVVLGSALCGAWVWNLEQASQTFRQAMTTQAQELASLKAAIELTKARAAPADTALTDQLQGLRIAVTQRTQLRDALKQGLFEPGWGHSDRLALIARTIPSQAWITEVKMEGTRLEVLGYTLETTALTEWVDKLAVAPLTQGLKLGTVKVENVPMPAALLPASSASAPAAPQRPVWSFQLVSAVPMPSVSASNSRRVP